MAKKQTVFRSFSWLGRKSAPPPPPVNPSTPQVGLPYGPSADPLNGIFPTSQMGAAYDAAVRGDGAGLGRMLSTLPADKMPSLWDSIKAGTRQAAFNFRLGKALETRMIAGKQRAIEAAAQGTNINWAMDSWGVYDTNGVRHPTSMTFDFLRYFCSKAECIAWIIGKRVNQVVNFSRRAEIRRGQSSTPGFKIGLTKKSEKATPEDQEIIDDLEQWFEECGYCAPPMENRRIGWQPGFANFLSELTRDRLTLDHVAVRRWYDSQDPENGDMVCFACEDAARVLWWSREYVDIVDGHLIEEPREGERTNTKKEIFLVKVADGGAILEEFTEREVFVAHQRSRTDKNANGYGYVEAEEAFEYATMFIAARDFNGLRFSTDGLPRGIMSITGNMTDAQFAGLQKFFKESTQGLKKRWNIPMIKQNPQAGSGVEFIPFDLSPRDMEHSQTTYMAGLIPHILYQISPDETGWSSASPFRAPLSEASPETNLQYSQDTGLTPLLRWIEDILNREILWKRFPNRRYSFKFVGMGDYDQQADVMVRTARLQGGLSTPEMEWAETDTVMPKWVADHPASKMPMPWPVGFQMLQSIQQQAQAADQQQQQTAQAGAQQQQQGDISSWQAAKEGYQQDSEGQPDPAGTPAPAGAGSPGGGPGGTQPIGGASKQVQKAAGLIWPFED